MEPSENNVNQNQPEQPAADTPVDQATIDAARKLLMPGYEFNIGGILSSTFSTTLKNPLLFIGLALLAILPASLIFAILPLGSAGPIISAIVIAILVLVIQGAITYAVFQINTGHKAAIMESALRGLARFLPVLLASIIVGFGVGIGTLFFVIPGIIISCICAVTIPVCVVERMGPVDSITRSAFLTKGCRLKIFALMLILGLINMAIMLIIPTIFVAMTDNAVVLSIVISLVSALPKAFECVMISTVYYELRKIKEGVTLDTLASVFD
ncbi:hypothetical protein LJC48_07240 [Desulfovibrio sp. OttesenSCG-928-C06]|nr:hypothetical protein [Desulfovibrio sp. OttesenSCG-928-C06]